VSGADVMMCRWGIAKDQKIGEEEFNLN